jgi:ATP-dependent Lon protease
LPEEAHKEAERELKRLSKMHPSSAEYTVSTTYLDWLTTLPWNTSTTDNLDIKKARKILDDEHYGLEKPKKRIIEYLAVRKLKSDSKGPILCFAGPPGTGKTSLGQSIAHALGRQFVRISLGGVRDEAEIRGHRRTYIGALPGRIIQGIRRAESNNPVFMLDEIDKVGSDFRGDPSAALLEVLDPQQNFSFSDHYLDVAFDLSKVMFITTANILDTVPPALRDRMEVLQLLGYTQEEKLKIANRFLIPRQRAEHGLKASQITFNQGAVRHIIEGYTREAGLRNLEREIANICRGVAARIAGGDVKKTAIKTGDVAGYLGPVRFTPESKARVLIPGVATGLAWTPVGGELLFIEATAMQGQNRLTLTGQLGDVMKESAQAALTFIRTHTKVLGIDDNFFEKKDIHIHIPAGAIPKDGPSAGVTMLAALVSFVTGRKVKKNLAMTGEITLRGQVLPVGGIKEKMLAAYRAGIKTVILPQENQKDLEELPANVRKRINFHFVEKMLDVVKLALEKK